MAKKRIKSTRKDFLKACEKNGIVFKQGGKSKKNNYIEVIDENGDIIKLTKTFSLFNNPYR